MEKLANIVDIFETAKQGTVLYCTGGKLDGESKDSLMRLLEQIKNIRIQPPDRSSCDVNVCGFDVMSSLTHKNSIALSIGNSTAQITVPSEVFF